MVPSRRNSPLISLVSILVFLVVPLHSQTSAVRAFAIRDVTVLPMDSDRELAHVTVVVRGGKITQIGPADSTKIPAGTHTIDGHGKFVMPGLADMHTHVDRAEMLPLFLSAGVTTVLNMGLASPEFVIATRQRVVRGEIPGPRIYTSFMIDGPGDPGPEYVALCERDAREAVDRAKLVGYDFIKAYDRLQPEIYAAVLDEAKKQKIAVVGHVPAAVGLESSLAQGQVMVAHAEEYYKTFFQDHPDENRIGPAVELTRKTGAYVTPNLSFFSTLTQITSDPSALDRRLAEKDAAYLPPDIRDRLLSRRPAKPSDQLVPELAILRKLTLALSKAGVPVLTGTDSPLLETPGVSVNDDLEQLVAAGLTPFEALVAATRTPGEFIAKFVPEAPHFGTVDVGNQADLLLLAANPLDDIRNARNPVVVVADGRLYERQQLLELITKPVPKYLQVEQVERDFRKAVGRLGGETAARKLLETKMEVKPTEAFVNALGYELIQDRKLEDAIAIFQLNAQLYPDSWNVYDSLGEAYADAQRFDEAVVQYRRSLALNPKNRGAEEVLKKAEEMRLIR